MTTQLHKRIERLSLTRLGGVRPLVLRTVEGEPPGMEAQRLADYLRQTGHQPIAALPSKCASDEEWIALYGRGDAA